MPLFRLHASDGDDVGVIASQEDPQSGETITAGDGEAWLVLRGASTYRPAICSTPS